MPELPEVETIKKQLMKKIPMSIERVEYSNVVESILKRKDRLFDPSGMVLRKIERLGKLLIFDLDGGHYLLSHLGMSGSWRISEQKVLEKHTHIQIEGKNQKGKKVFFAYIDPRRFGNVYLVDEEGKKKHLEKLGVDISGREFDESYLQKIFQKFPNKVLKPFLLDQKYFAGCGNYIASEICARAGILPTRKCGEVKKNEYKKIIKATQSVLEEQIQNNGLTFSGGYQDAYGNKGEGVLNLVVFHQKVCGLCQKSEVIKIVLGQRGTFYCPKCQK